MKRDRTVMIGSGCIDEYYELSHMPAMREKAICHPLGAQVGGMTGSAASVAATCGMDTYPMDTVNRGLNVQTVLEDCRKRGIKLDPMRHDDSLPDVKCIIFLKDGGRVIYVVPTQKRELVLDEAQEAISKGTSYVYSSTAEIRCFTRPLKVLDKFRDWRIRLVLDVGYLDSGIIESEWEVIKRAGILFVNTEEDRQMRKQISLDYISVLNKSGCIVAAIKGGQGCSIYEPSGERNDIDAFRITPVNITGAGDTFSAGSVYGMSQGLGVREAGEYVSAAVAKSILYMGPRSGAVGAEQVEQFISTYKGKFKEEV